MNWADEPWVKVYTRDTPKILALKWQGRTVLWEFVRKADRAGVIAVGTDDPDERAEIIADMFRLPVDVVSAGLGRLIDKGTVEAHLGGYLVLVDHIEAQAASSSNNERARRSRARRRAIARARKEGIIPESGDDVTECDERPRGRDQQDLPFGKAGPPADGLGGNGAASSADGTPPTPDSSLPDATNRDKASRIVTEPSRPAVTNRIDQTRSDQTRVDHTHADPRARARASLQKAADIANRINSFDFESVYRLYPRKAGKKKGLEAAKRKIRTRTEFEVFKGAVVRMAELWDGASREQLGFCPYFSTFVNGEAWRDDELPEPRDRNGRHRGYAAAPTADVYDAADDIGID